MGKVAPMFDAPDGLKGYVGEEDGFDPLRLSSAFDMKWLREVEVKHGRICMLAFVGFVAGDLLPLPGVTLSIVAAHDANLGEYGGAMGQIFWWIGLVEILGSIPAINYTMNGGARPPHLPLRLDGGATDSRSRHEYATQCCPFGGCAPPLFTLESAFYDPTPMVVNSHAPLQFGCTRCNTCVPLPKGVIS